MRFLELKFNDETFTKNSEIDNILESQDLSWLQEAEIENAKIEIRKKTLIWYNGYFFGNWHYGIFKNGEFHGTFQNGILEGGDFQGEFVSGINLMEV
jgi:hypothetical protein